MFSDCDVLSESIADTGSAPTRIKANSSRKHPNKQLLHVSQTGGARRGTEEPQMLEFQPLDEQLLNTLRLARGSQRTDKDPRQGIGFGKDTLRLVRKS